VCFLWYWQRAMHPTPLQLHRALRRRLTQRVQSMMTQRALARLVGKLPVDILQKIGALTVAGAAPPGLASS
jgi:hypothetical protein